MHSLYAFVFGVALAIGLAQPMQAATLQTLTTDPSVGVITDDTAGSDAVLGAEVFFDSFFGIFTVDAFSPGVRAPLGGAVDSFSASIVFDPFTGELDPSSDSTFGLATDRLSGDVIEASFETDQVLFLLDVQGGDLASTFGSLAILTLSGFSVDASVGPSAFPDLFGSSFGESANFTIEKAAAVIPLPPAFLLLLSALGFTFVLRRSSAS